MNNLVNTEDKASARTGDANRFLNNKDTQRLAKRFNSFLLENYHYERGRAFWQIYFAAEREMQLLIMAHSLFSEMHLLRKELDAEDDRREVLLDAACDLATFIQKMCGVWIL